MLLLIRIIKIIFGFIWITVTIFKIQKDKHVRRQ
jgi:hypothetical protein